MEAFRAHLAAEGLFYPPFEAARFAELTPGERELFVGLPLMTPVSQRFLQPHPPERLLVDAPLFGPHMPTEPPEYETALSLVRRIGVAERRDPGEGLSFSELAERAALPALLAREIDAFFGGPRGDGAQLFIVPLDERLSFYLWEFSSGRSADGSTSRPGFLSPRLRRPTACKRRSAAAVGWRRHGGISSPT